MTDTRVQRDVVEIVSVRWVKRVKPPQIVGDAQRPHRVTDTDAVNADLAGIGAAKEFGLYGPSTEKKGSNLLLTYV